MRIGQLARQYDVSVQEIISHFDEMNYNFDSDRPNVKLSDEALNLVKERFANEVDIPAEEIIEEIEEIIEESVLEEPTELVEEPTEESSELREKEAVEEEPIIEVVEESNEALAQNESPKEEQVIETDRLLELLESEGNDVDLSKITHIKASKRELEGLKVVGKIDLPEPKVKAEKTEDAEEGVSGQKNRNQGSKLGEEEREKRRLQIRKQKEQYEARQERRLKEDENRRKRAKKKAHYERNIQPVKPSEQKPKVKKPTSTTPSVVTEKHPEPKTFFGKFWRWLNPKGEY